MEIHRHRIKSGVNTRAFENSARSDEISIFMLCTFTSIVEEIFVR